MHISEGVLAAPVLAAGALLAATGVAVGLKKMPYEKIPQVAVLSSTFFVASLIQIPLGPASAHLVLNGLLGIILGWMAVPSIFVALSLQALLFQFGGFTSLGVNTFNVSAPALMAYFLFRPLLKRDSRIFVLLSGFAAGVVGGIGGVSLIALSLITTGEVFINVVRVIVIAHLPVIIIEGIITMFILSFLRRVKPEILEVHK